MTETEKILYQKGKEAERIELEALMTLVHDSYKVQFKEELELEISKEDGKWKVVELNNDIGFEMAHESLHTCLEYFYVYILEAVYSEELEREAAEEAIAEEEYKRELNLWLDSQCMMSYDRY